MPAISNDDAVASATAAADWLVAGQQDDGRYLYEYNRSTDVAAEGSYNLVRHAGVTMSLYQLAAAGADDGLDAADIGLEYMLDRLRTAGDGRALVERGATLAPVGASALMVATLLDRRAATGDEGYDDELMALGRFLVGQVDDRGRVSAGYDLTADVPTPESSAYVTGEAAWALARLHTTFPSEDGRGAAARRVAEYLATERDDDEAIAPQPWPDQWAAYLLAELAPTGLSEAQAAYARDLASPLQPARADGIAEGRVAHAVRRRPRPRGRPRRLGRGCRLARSGGRGRPPPRRTSRPPWTSGWRAGPASSPPGRSMTDRCKRWGPGSATMSPGWTTNSTACRRCSRPRT